MGTRIKTSQLSFAPQNEYVALNDSVKINNTQKAHNFPFPPFKKASDFSSSPTKLNFVCSLSPRNKQKHWFLLKTEPSKQRSWRRNKEEEEDRRGGRWRVTWTKTSMWRRSIPLRKLLRNGVISAASSRTLNAGFASPRISPNAMKRLRCAARTRSCLLLLLLLLLLSCDGLLLLEGSLYKTFYLQEKLRIAVLVSKAAFQFISGELYVSKAYIFFANLCQSSEHFLLISVKV